jgi:hypothetical protein
VLDGEQLAVGAANLDALSSEGALSGAPTRN